MSEENGLPRGWVEASVGEIAGSIQYGHTASAADDSLGPRFLRITDIQNGQVDWATVPSCEIASDEIEKYRLRSGDIVFARTGATTGKSYLIRDCPEAVFASYLIRLRMHDGIFAPYVQAFFQTNDYWRQIEGGKRGIGQPNVNASVLGTIRLPIAPPNQQRRIVAKIEELFSDLDAGVAALERAKANLKRFRAAVLKAAVEGKLTEQWRAEHPNTEPASKLLARILTARRKKWEAAQLAKFNAAGKQPPKNWREKYVEPSPPETTDLPDLPEGWCWAKLDQLLVYLRNGYFQSPSGAEHGTPILRINAVRQMRVDLSEARFLDKINGNVDDYFIENGDLLFTRYNGSVDLLGVAGMVRGCTEKVLHPDKLIRVKLALGQSMPSFVEIAANVGVSRKHMVGRARTTAGQTGISGPDVREIPIPLPPLDEQACIVNEVAEKLSQIGAAEVVIDRGLLRAARLRQSILKQAFEGKLVPQDPQDEPASMLLEQIRSNRSCPRLNGAKQSASRTRGRRGKTL